MAQLNREIKPQITTWKADLEKIAGKYFTQEQLNNAKNIKQKINENLGKKLSRVGFILMDTSMSPDNFYGK